MNINADIKKKEAVKRMKALAVFVPTIDQFENDGYISISEPPFGAFYWAEGDDLARIREFEARYNAMVYMVVRSFTTIGKLDAYLYVSDDEDEREDDMEDIKEKTPLAYVYNHDAPEFSEFGRIRVDLTIAGGLVRKG